MKIASGTLTLPGPSSEQVLVPDSKIALRGSRSLHDALPISAANRSGPATITVTVADPEGATASQAFLLTVKPVNDPPTLTGLSDQFTDEDRPKAHSAVSI